MYLFTSYLRTYLHTYLCTYLRTYLRTCLRAYLRICLHLIYLDNNCFTINDDITSPAHEGTKEILPFIL